MFKTYGTLDGSTVVRPTRAALSCEMHTELETYQNASHPNKFRAQLVRYDREKAKKR